MNPGAGTCSTNRPPNPVAALGTTLRMAPVETAASTGLPLCTGAPQVRADAVAYLVDATARPGHDVTDAETAPAYGNGRCDGVRAGGRYARVVWAVKRDFGTSEEHQASCLIGRPVGELCSARSRWLGQSVTGYVPFGRS